MRKIMALILALMLMLCAGAAAEGETISSDGTDETSGLRFEDVTVVSEDPLTLRFSLKNEGERTVIGFWTLLYGTDADGVEVYIHDDHGWWTDAAMAPGESGCAADVELPGDVPAATFHTLVLAAAYDDGSEWELGGIDHAQAQALGLTAEWSLPQGGAG